MKTVEEYISIADKFDINDEFEQAYNTYCEAVDLIPDDSRL